jgi:hypothetical protein
MIGSISIKVAIREITLQNQPRLPCRKNRHSQIGCKIRFEPEHRPQIPNQNAGK